MHKHTISLIAIVSTFLMSGCEISAQNNPVEISPPPIVQVNTEQEPINNPCNNQRLNDIRLTPQTNKESVFLVSSSDFMKENEPLKIKSLDDLIKGYNDSVVRQPPCSSYFFEVNSEGMYIFTDVPDNDVFEKCWNRNDKWDLDKDGRNEEIITATIAMTKSPQVAGILKEGKLIFAYEGASIGITPLEENSHDKGFYLSVGNPLLQNDRKIKYIFDDKNEAIPVWEEVYCN